MKDAYLEVSGALIRRHPNQLSQTERVIHVQCNDCRFPEKGWVQIVFMRQVSGLQKVWQLSPIPEKSKPVSRLVELPTFEHTPSNIPSKGVYTTLTRCGNRIGCAKPKTPLLSSCGRLAS
ncbi:uncharacterized protein PHALS_07849 [Plasmopara halstedii]|uniref:Uncharacterized protein n=1 Tax=Plasmopara halstedii TaxID=4781 RepID=A0A0N7L8K4_PLAHL|nr:uncharacterized protein PHALS_07849 [Plasmopara halstedii]CEG50123.1 hypothetical protein PHALS_07849 [Plasmopara halstedii]|eukprot:XP_024586492.1 hypothetical protein PHALS_07849 [Plasmopara halstedii]